MPSTTVQYINPNQDSKEIKNIPKDIRIFYLKATIAILTLAFATVSAILVWRLLESKNNCDEHLTEASDQDKKDEIPVLSSRTRTPNEEKTWQCPQVGKKKSLPYTLPRGVQQTFQDVKKLLKEKIGKKTL
ncbi:Hypothetical predicted protein, partial [Paramuricea clavata]